MHENERQASGAILLWLPVTMAKNAAAVRWIYDYLFSNRLDIEGGTREEVANNGLHMTI